MWRTSRGNKFPSNQHSVWVLWPERVVQATRATSGLQAKKTCNCCVQLPVNSPQNPLLQACLPPSVLGSAEPGSSGGWGRLRWGSRAGQEVPAASTRPLSSAGEPSPPCKMGIMCVGCFHPHAGHHGKVTRTAAVVVGGCRDVALRKRRHLSELPESIEVSSLWHQ